MCMSYVLDTGRVPRHNMDLLADHWLGQRRLNMKMSAAKVNLKFALISCLQSRSGLCGRGCRYHITFLAHV